MMDTDSVEQQSHSNFDHVRLSEEQSDGSVADVEDDPGEIPQTKFATRKKIVKKKKTKKTYFRSDFTGEQESSSDDDDLDKNNKKQGVCALNPGDLSWPMWAWYYVVIASTKTFYAAEFCGEKLADLFGITTPKYQYVIDEYHRLKQEGEEEEEAERCAEEYIRQQELQKIQTLEGGETEVTTRDNENETGDCSKDTL